MTVEILTSIAELERNRVPAVVAINATRQNAAVHTNKACDDEKSIVAV